MKLMKIETEYINPEKIVRIKQIQPFQSKYDPNKVYDHVLEYEHMNSGGILYLEALFFSGADNLQVFDFVENKTRTVVRKRSKKQK